MRTSYDSDSSKWPELWQAAYRLLEQRIVEDQLKAWVQPLHFVGSQKDDQGSLRVELQAPNQFSAQWVRDRMAADISQALSQVAGTPCYLQINHLESAPSSPNTASVEESNNSSVAPPSSPAPSKKAGGFVVQASYGPNEGRLLLDPRFTFDNFVVGASNQFAYASSVAVSESIGQQYNPLFLYSSPGLGKTHLLHAIGNHVKKTRPDARVEYITAETFVNELIESLKLKSMAKFRAKYRNSYDMLLIDDIQFIAGKKQTEEEFFHTFNTLYGSKRQIVLTSDRPPKEIEKLEERVRTRFEWGLVADIQPPEIETRIAILKTKAESDDIYLPEEVATYLATHVKSDVRKLEGTLISLQAQASLTGAEITLDMAKDLLKKVIGEATQLTTDTIQNAVARFYRIKNSDLQSQSRAHPVAIARQVAMYLTQKYIGLKLKEIGRVFGKRDHTTVMYACKKIEQSLESDETIRDAVEKIQNQL